MPELYSFKHQFDIFVETWSYSSSWFRGLFFSLIQHLCAEVLENFIYGVFLHCSFSTRYLMNCIKEYILQNVQAKLVIPVGSGLIMWALCKIRERSHRDWKKQTRITKLQCCRDHITDNDSFPTEFRASILQLQGLNSAINQRAWKKAQSLRRVCSSNSSLSR